jgi:MoaA/NifB/PqqE/SkfB family radical SAM enzyme
MKIANTALGILGSWFLDRPFYARVHVTYRCNYRCRMCGISSIRPQYDELDPGALDRVAAQLRTLGARHVVITGGEPFLRKDLADIVASFARRGFSIRIQTNGGPHVTRERIAEVARAGAADLSVSVDTLDAGLQDQISRGRDTLEHALRALGWALELMPRGMSLANIVASPHNFAELPGLVRRFGAAGIYTYITPAVVIGDDTPAGDGYLFRGEDATFSFAGIPANERDRVIRELVALRRHGYGLTNSTRHLEDFGQFLATGSSRWPCARAAFTLDVRPDGSVSACKEKPPLGHILDPSFASFYRGGEFRRQAAAGAASCGGCFYGEYREPSYAIRDGGVLREWTVDWLRTFRKGMGWTGTRTYGPRPLIPSDAPGETEGRAPIQRGTQASTTGARFGA